MTEQKVRRTQKAKSAPQQRAGATKSKAKSSSSSKKSAKPSKRRAPTSIFAVAVGVLSTTWKRAKLARHDADAARRLIESALPRPAMKLVSELIAIRARFRPVLPRMPEATKKPAADTAASAAGESASAPGLTKDEHAATAAPGLSVSAPGTTEAESAPNAEQLG